MEFYALNFLNQWLTIEKNIYEKVQSQDEKTILEGISDGAKHFRIARTLPKKYEKKQSKERYEPVLEIIFKEDLQLDPNSEVAEIVAEKESRLSKFYGGRSVISATTKFLWLKYRNPVRILDSQAKNSLNINTNNYHQYSTRWDKIYTEMKNQVYEASIKLPSVSKFAYDPNADIVKISQSDWFQQRVFDNYLWFNG